MQIFTYIFSFIIGTLLGSFCTLAIHRIPLKQDILYKHSYCPNCNNKLKFLDLIPVLSYIFLKGKCRYCKKPIKIKYLIIELLFGICFMMYTISIKFNILTLKLNTIIFYVYSIIYITILFIIAGIDKEKIQIHIKVILFGFIFELLYMIYLCIYNNNLIYMYQLIYFIIGLIIIYKLQKNKCKYEYILSIILLYMYITIYSGILISAISLLISCIVYAVINCFYKNKLNKIPAGFIISISNIVIILCFNLLENYII